MLATRPFSARLIPLFVALTLCCAAACRARGESPAPVVVDWELRSFEVPAGDRSQLVEILGTLLKDKGRVSLGPDGRLLVLASPATHKSIQVAILDHLRDRPAGATPASLSLSYWMVLGRSTPGGGTTAAIPPTLQEIAPALEELARATGNAQLTLLERMRVSALSGTIATSDGRAFSLYQRASVAGGTVVSDVRISALMEESKSISRREMLNTRVSLRPGQIAVVGETGVRGLPVGLAGNHKDDGGNTLFFIVRASVDDAAAAGK